MFYAYLCKSTSCHRVVTPTKSLGAVPGGVCPFCGGKLEFFKDFPSQDAGNRVGFNDAAARVAIAQNGYFAYISPGVRVRTHIGGKRVS